MIPALAASLPERQYTEGASIVGFWMDDVYLMVFPEKVLVNRVVELTKAEAAMKKLDELLARLKQRIEGGSPQ